MTSHTSAVTCTASLNRNDEWIRCCAVASGFEWIDFFDNSENEKEDHEIKGGTILQLTNLMVIDDDRGDDFEEEKCGIEDIWTDNAFRIQSDLTRMSRWIQSKKQKYVGLDMRDNEAALIQSTVTSYAATTASELETMRNMINNNNNSQCLNNDILSHRAGVVKILLDQLQEKVTKPFGTLQKQRSRLAVKLWQNPLQCKLYQPKYRNETIGTIDQSRDKMFDVDDENKLKHGKEQRFLPERSYQIESNNVYDFIFKYENKQHAKTLVQEPDFLIGISMQQRLGKEKQHALKLPVSLSEETKQEQTADVGLPSFLNESNAFRQDRSHDIATVNDRSKFNDYYQKQLENELETESVQLATTLIANKDLDSVHQMETRMVEITTLIGQFSNLVQDQQEQVLQVHESAKETKDNLDKGQENLIDAAERTRESKHYKAWLIFFLTMILLFFHIVRN